MLKLNVLGKWPFAVALALLVVSFYACPRSAESSAPHLLEVTYPRTGVLFPRDIVAPIFRWSDTSEAEKWQITVSFTDLNEPIQEIVSQLQWQPDAPTWKTIKRRSLKERASVKFEGLHNDGSTVLSDGIVWFSTSEDPVGAPIFYRDVPLPFTEAIKNLGSIRWRLGDSSSPEEPRIVLENMNVCGNCHSFSADGKTLAMDVDYGSDKGSYIITEISPKIVFNKKDVISWSDYKKDDKEPTLGLLSQLSPDGRYVLSTVKDRSVFVPRAEIHYSQFFFPVKGVLAVYDRETKTLDALSGADDPKLVQSNPSWSPDGKWVVFARDQAHEVRNSAFKNSVFLSEDEVQEFISGETVLRYNLYRVPFNNGKGGAAEPLAGASHNGKSNFFAKYSPDGKWIVFCQADGFMLLRPDSLLYIMPAEGGIPRQMSCNKPGYMNSWHSFSPNGKWLVFSSKARGPYTQLWLTHIDEQGKDSPPVLLEHFTSADRAANIPEFVNIAHDDLREIVPTFTDEYSLIVRTGRMNQQSDQHQKAINDFKNALKMKAHDVEVMVYLCESLLATKSYDEALLLLKRAEDLEPNNPDVETMLAVVLYKKGSYDLAIAHGERALDLDAQMVVARYTLGLAYHRKANLSKAGEHYQKAIEAGENRSAAYTNYGMVLKGLGKYDEAVQQFQNALRADSENQTARTSLLETLKLKRLQSD